MSQFLICKSKNEMTKYGIRLQEVEFNKDLYLRVINKYMPDVSGDEVWVIENIHNLLNALEYNLNYIEEICRNSELMVFWYGCDYDELERIDSRQMLMDYLKDNISNSCLEIYLFVDLRNEF